MARKKVLGIDLGTTYSCVAYVNDYGVAEVILNQRNERTTPSVVWFDADHAIVGREAKEMSSIHPNEVCCFIKRQMGKDDYTFEVNGVKYSPEHISSLILRKLVQDAWARLGEEIRDVVITCPAYFFIKERDATKLAGEQAGLNVLQIVNEPTAAAVSYGIQSKETQDEDIILVYDLGGGTFDVTVMKVSASGLDVICTDGEHQLGGKNWDDRLTQYFAQRFSEETGVEVDLSIDIEFYYDLMTIAEDTKIHLSSKQSTTVRINRGGEKIRFEITREEFEDLTRDLIEKTIELTCDCLEKAQDNAGIEGLDQIILVGGSSRMPQVSAALFELLKAKPSLYDPDEAVAKGAAIIGNNIAIREEIKKKISEENQSSRSLILDDVPEDQKERAAQKVAEETGISLALVQGALRSVKNVSSKSFGAITTNDDGFRSVSNIIYRNTPIPCEETQTFATLSDFQSSVLIELESNSMDRSPTYDQDILEITQTTDPDRFEELFWKLNAPEEESEKLWEGDLQIQPGLRRGAPIDITYKLDENGLLTVIVTDQASGNQLIQTIETGAAHQEVEFQQATERSRSLIVE
ncbi:MAG: Hsp70 family protein [Planctomycetia bacterium]|nr:Hsp70 family protein [Planctomycetia bacterium]